MKPLLLAGLLSLFSFLSVHAQDSTTSHPQPDSVIKIIPFGQGKYTGYLYTIGGRIQSPEDVKLRLLSYAPSAAEFALAKENATWSWICLSAFAVSTLAAAVEFKNNNQYAGTSTTSANGDPITYQQHDLTGGYLFLGTGIGFGTTAFITLFKAKKHQKESLRLYNRRFE